MGQSKKERERGRSGGTRRTKEQVLVVDKEKGRRGCLAGKQRARSIKTGQLGRGFLGPGFPLGSRVCSIRKFPRPLYPDNSAHLSFIVCSIPLSARRHSPHCPACPACTLYAISCMRCYLCVTVSNRFSADRELYLPLLCSCASYSNSAKRP